MAIQTYAIVIDEEAVPHVRQAADGNWVTAVGHAEEVTSLRAEFLAAIAEKDRQIEALVEDRNLWQEAHDEDCPNKAEIEALQWKPITPESLPRRGDECLEPPTETHIARVIPVGFDPREGDEVRYLGAGFTHFRPINAPALAPKQP